MCFALMTLAVAPARGGQPTLDELLDLDSPEDQREALRDAAAEDEGGEQEREQAQSEDSPRDPGADALEETLQQMLDEQDPSDLFHQAVRDMADVSRRLGDEFDTGVETQRMQQSILDKLDQVIAAAQRQQQGEPSESSSQSQSGEPSAQQADTGAQNPAQQNSGDSSESSGGADSQQAQGDQPHSGEASPGRNQEAADPSEALRELRQEWGNLPPRLRDEIAEGMNERFSPVYRPLTEAYYRRLAEEESE